MLEDSLETISYIVEEFAFNLDDKLPQMKRVRRRLNEPTIVAPYEPIMGSPQTLVMHPDQDNLAFFRDREEKVVPAGQAQDSRVAPPQTIISVHDGLATLNLPEDFEPYTINKSGEIELPHFIPTLYHRPKGNTFLNGFN